MNRSIIEDINREVRCISESATKLIPTTDILTEIEENHKFVIKTFNRETTIHPHVKYMATATLNCSRRRYLETIRKCCCNISEMIDTIFKEEEEESSALMGDPDDSDLE